MCKIQNKWGYSLLECIKIEEEYLEKKIYVPTVNDNVNILKKQVNYYKESFLRIMLV